MIRLIESTPMGSDCTQGFIVELDKHYTVAEFMSEILNTRGKSEWGCFEITDSDTKEEDYCHYKRGSFEEDVNSKFAQMEVLSVKSHGGWSRMDYYITAEFVPEDSITTDEIGGVHSGGIGWAPDGTECGECCFGSCKECVNVTEKVEKLLRPKLYSGTSCYDNSKVTGQLLVVDQKCYLVDDTVNSHSFYNINPDAFTEVIPGTVSEIKEEE